jgi:hypothetical protein
MSSLELHGSRSLAAQKAIARNQQVFIGKDPPSQEQTQTIESDLKRYVLYVSSAKNRRPMCQKALDLLALNAALKLDFFIVDIDDILIRPKWMENIPCMVLKEEKKALSEDGCIRFLMRNIAEYKSKEKTFQKRKALGHQKPLW